MNNELYCRTCKHKGICRPRSIMKGSAFCDKMRGFMSKERTSNWNKFKALFGK